MKVLTILLFSALVAAVIFNIVKSVMRRRGAHAQYPQLDDHDWFKISQGVHATYLLDNRTGRIRVRDDPQEYLVPGGGVTRDHYPMTDEEYRASLHKGDDELELAMRLRPYARRWRVQMELENPESSREELERAEAEGKDVCYGCMRIEPPRCTIRCSCDGTCLICDQAGSAHECYMCDSD